MLNTSDYSYNYIIHCPFCEHTKFKPMGKGTHKSNTFHKTIVQCSSCGLLFANPIADRKSMEVFYSNYGEHKIKIGDIANEFRIHAKEMNEYFHNMNGGGGKRFLDIGAYTGDVMLSYKELGWEVEGVELSKTAVAFAKQHRGIDNILSCEIEDAPYPNNHFDYINFWHVIEHLRDPIIVLRKIFDWLKPGGQLKLGTPNPITPMGNIQTLVTGVFDLGPDHTFGYPKATMKRIFTEIGFEIVAHDFYPGSRKNKSLQRKIIDRLGLYNTMQRVIANKPK